MLQVLVQLLKTPELPKDLKVKRLCLIIMMLAMTLREAFYLDEGDEGLEATVGLDQGSSFFLLSTGQRNKLKM